MFCRPERNVVESKDLDGRSFDELRTTVGKAQDDSMGQLHCIFLPVFERSRPMKMNVVVGDQLNQVADVSVVYVFRGVKRLAGMALVMDRALQGEISAAIESGRFEGKEGERMMLTTLGALKAKRVVVVGLGAREDVTIDTLRKAGGILLKVAREQKAKTLVYTLPSIRGISTRECGQAIAEGMLLGAYRFHQYKGVQHVKDVPGFELEQVRIMAEDVKSAAQYKEGIERGCAFAEATMLARDLVNTPSSAMGPTQLAAAASALVKRGSGISCQLLDQKAMEGLGMQAALAVARGSAHEPVGVHLIYRPSGKTKKRVAIVGKAVTFDSGGLSIKPADGMMTMKIDMAGAASVIGLFALLPMLKPNIEVHGIFLAVENMTSGSAYRPGDVVTAMDGTTIEVLNTDAEGRVTLADALTYAKRQEPDMIIDLATLTGACVVALGEEVAAVLGNNDALTQKLLTAAKETGESLWQLPLFEAYTQHIKSKIADIKNIGGGHGGGVITAALFLKTFVGETPWAHLDIAGPSYTERETRPDQPYGASGYGVRLLAKFIEGMGK